MPPTLVQGWMPQPIVMVPTPDHINDGRFASLSIHYANERGLLSCFSFVEHHLTSFLPNLFLSETKLSGNVSPDGFNIFHYNLYFNFRLNNGVCACCNINTPIKRLMYLESPNFWVEVEGEG